MNQKKLLVIEDDISIGDILCYSLRKEGFKVKCITNGKDGLQEVDNFLPDLILLDIMLPDINGFEVCKRITEKHPIPIIMLTARNDIVDKVLGLELGADDYISKPFDIREVVARIKVALRRTENLPFYQDNKYIYINSNIKINPEARTVYKNNFEIKLKPKEYDLLLMFCQNKNRTFTRDEILDKVWDIDYEGDLRTVDVHVQRLRKKLDDEKTSSLIETVFGIGYKMRSK